MKVQILPFFNFLLGQLSDPCYLLLARVAYSKHRIGHNLHFTAANPHSVQRQHSFSQPQFLSLFLY